MKPAVIVVAGPAFYFLLPRDSAAHCRAAYSAFDSAFEKRYLITEYKGVEEDGSNYYEHVTTNFTYDKNGNLTKESVVFGTDIISRADYYYTYTQR